MTDASQSSPILHFLQTTAAAVHCPLMQTTGSHDKAQGCDLKATPTLSVARHVSDRALLIDSRDANDQLILEGQG